jgi:hypothetical protein
VLDGDPLTDLHLLRNPKRISMVVQGGRVVTGGVGVAEPAAL